MRKQADALKVCPIPDVCLLVMAQRPSRLLGLPETRSLIFLIKNSPDQVEGYLDYLQPRFNDVKTLICSGDNEARFEVHISPHTENILPTSVEEAGVGNLLQFEIELETSQVA
jgi:hypothetical protein